MPDKKQPWFPEKRLALFLANDEDEIKLCCDAIKAQAALFTVEVIKNGRQALEALSNGNYDLVVMDFALPDMDGEEWVSLAMN